MRSIVSAVKTAQRLEVHHVGGVDGHDEDDDDHDDEQEEEEEDDGVKEKKEDQMELRLR